MLVAQILAAAGIAPESLTLSLDVARRMFSYAWPRNVRELEHRLKLGAVLAKGGVVELDHLFGSDAASAVGEYGVPEVGAARRRTSEAPLALEAEDRARRDQLIALLREHRGNVTAVARTMGKARVQVQRWMRRYGLSRRESP